jgi:cell division protein FtsB
VFEKIKKYRKHPYVDHLKDVRFIGLVVFGVIVLLVTWSSLDAIQSNYELQKQVTKLEQQNELHKLDNANLKLKNEYYNTEQYLELTARRQFGVAAPGEKVLLIPKEVALAHSTDLPKPDQQKIVEEDDRKPWYQHNFEAWMDFLFHRQSQLDG